MSFMIVWKHRCVYVFNGHCPYCHGLRIHVAAIMDSSARMGFCSGIGSNSCAKIRFFVKIDNHAVAFNS